MLRRQDPRYDPMSFLAGHSEMARRIREFDWSGHPFGPPETWPQSLRSALSICLHSSFPTAIYWGGDLRLLYNDAWAPIPGPRHPAALGAPAREVWADIWHVIEPQFEQLIATGEGLFVENQLLPMRRYGLLEETYWTYSFTAIRGENGAIEGVFNAGNETTHAVLHRRHTQFLLDLTEALRACADPAEARRVAVRMLGERFGLQRAGIREIVSGEGEELLSAMAEWTAPGVEPIGDGVRFSDFGSLARGSLMGGHVLRLNDIAADVVEPEARAAFGAYDVGAAVAVPWVKNGSSAAFIFLHSETPRQWADSDVEVLEKVTEHVMGWIERERAAERERIMMREIDHRSRNTLAVVQSLVRLTAEESVDAFRGKILNRIEALAHAHSLLASQRWANVELRRLLAEELHAFDDGVAGKVSLSGPVVTLDPDLAQMVAMLVHELATNAAKYGALRAAEGALAVTWRMEGGTLGLEWTERGVRQETSPRRRGGGFGSTLLARVVDQLGGRIEQRLGPDGLNCFLELPLRRTGDSAADPLTARPSAASTHAPAAAPPACAPGKPDRPRALIVEDEPIVAMDLAYTLGELGCDLIGSAASLGKGLDLLERSTPDFAILDADLAGESSQPIADRLAARGIPFIIVSGYEDVQISVPPGARHAILSKPIAERELAQTLERMLPADARAG